jgi:hypothetical protein
MLHWPTFRSSPRTEEGFQGPLESGGQSSPKKVFALLVTELRSSTETLM